MDFGVVSRMRTPCSSVAWTRWNAVLLTASHRVEIRDADDHKCTHSFAQRPGTEPYTCGAQQSPVTKTMFAVRGGSTLMSWKDDHTDSHTVTLPEEAAHLVVHRAVKGAVVVFQSGRLAVYSDTCSSIHTPSTPLPDVPASAVPVWASVSPNAAGALVFVLLQSPSSATATLALYLINTSGLHCVLQHTFTPSPSSPTSAGAGAGGVVSSATLSSASFHSGSNVLCLLWTRLNGSVSGAQWESHQFGETGRWYTSPPIVDCVRQIVTPPLPTPDTTTPTPTPSKTKKTKKPKKPTKQQKAVSATDPSSSSSSSGAPDPSLLAVSPTISLVVVPTSNSFFLSAWDVTHGVVLATTKVPRVTAGDADKPTPGTRLSVSAVLSPDRSRIVLLLSGGHGVPVLVPVAIGSSDLATCLGRMKDTRRWLTSPPTAAPSTPASEALRTVRAGTPSALADIVAAPPSHSVERSAVVRCLKELRAARAVSASTPVSAPSKKKARRKTGNKDKDKDKDVDTSAGGFDTLLIKLLKRRTVSAIANPTLIPTILHCQRLDLLEYALLTISDIPEASLVRIVRWLLAGVSPDAVSQFVGAKCRHYKHEAPPTGPKAHMATTRHFLCLIVAYKWNPLFLEHCVKQMVLSEVTVVLQVVLRLLRQLVSGPTAKRLSWKPALTDATDPTVGDVLEFVSVVVDAHVTPLVLGSANDGRVETILKTLKELVDLELELCDSLEAVHGYAEFVTKKLPLPISPVPDYSVEFLEL